MYPDNKNKIKINAIRPCPMHVFEKIESIRKLAFWNSGILEFLVKQISTKTEQAQEPRIKKLLGEENLKKEIHPT